MAQVFRKSTNTLSRVSLVVLAVLVVSVLTFFDQLQSSPYLTQVEVIREQPVPFSHEHHVGGLGIDCRYCHTSVEKSSFAGMPSPSTCMNCHSQIWSDSPELAPVRRAYQEGRAIAWGRVHDLPDFVYFNHSIHVRKGVGCASCHGPVDRMPLMWREASLNMGWCLDCHRNPEKHLRDTQLSARVQLPATISQIMRNHPSPHLHQRTDCYSCHR